MLCTANDDNDVVDEPNSSHERNQRARIRANLQQRRTNSLYGADTEAVEKTEVIFGFAAILIVAVVAVSTAKALSSAHSGPLEGETAHKLFLVAH